MSDEKPDLAFVSSEDLISELMDRHDAVVIGRLMRVTGNGKGDGEDEMFYDYAGGLTTALGLAIRVQDGLLELAAKKRRFSEDEEEDEET